MSNWTNGYVSDVDYTHGYYREISPAHLRFALLAKGFRPPEVDAPGFTYCELGFGQGVSLTIHAAAHPAARFAGADFNPVHAAGAQARTHAAGVTNLDLTDDSFADMLTRTDLPMFDAIVLHGIYSWISAENRATIVAFLRQKLKVGGVVYVSYNAMPGWAAAMPLRELMTRHAATGNGPTPARIGRAMDFAKAVQEVGGGYFGANPQIGPRLDRLTGLSKNYLAHEYFNRDWTPLYHADVAQDFDDAKLTFAATATLAEQVDIVSVSAKGLEHLKTIDDPVLRETTRDFLTNQQFRRDLFVRGALRLSAQDQVQAARAVRFAPLVPRSTIPTSVSFPVGKVDLKPEIYGPLLDQLARGPATFGALIDQAGVSRMPFGALLQAMVIICSQNWAAACLGADGEDQRRVSTDRYNRWVLDQAMHSATLTQLASPVTGGGVTVDRLYQLFMMAEIKGKDPVVTTMTGLRELNQQLLKAGKPLTGEEETLVELGERYDHYRSKLRPIYQGLHLIPASGA